MDYPSHLARNGIPSSPLVSVIIPAYNAEAFIERTLRSALNQTYRNIEILVVDDGSQDGTQDLVRSLAEEDDRLVLLSQTNQGVAAARNLAIEHAQGAFIAPLDADDIWFPEKLERQVACMEEGGPAMGLVYSWWVMIDEDDVPVQASVGWNLAGEVFEALIFINFIGNASVPLMRTSSIEQVGGYSALLKEMGGQGCEDWDLALRIAAQYEVGVAPAYLCGYRRVRDSMSTDCRSMGQSHRLITRGLKYRHPHIPSYYFRWSGSIFNSYLGRLSYREGHYRSAQHWFVQALAEDPALLVSLPFLKQFAKTFLRRFQGPLLASVLRLHQAWRQGKPKQPKDPRPLVTLTKDRGPFPRSWTWRSWHPYDWVSWYRWRRVQARLDRHPDVAAPSVSRPEIRSQVPMEHTG